MAELLLFIAIVLLYWYNQYTTDKERKQDAEVFDFTPSKSTFKDTNTNIEKEPTKETFDIPSTWTIADKQAYMATREYNNKRNIRLHIDNYTCQACNATDVPLEVHHISYDNLGDENMADLISLCRICHQRQHEHYGYSYNTKYLPIIKE